MFLLLSILLIIETSIVYCTYHCTIVHFCLWPILFFMFECSVAFCLLCCFLFLDMTLITAAPSGVALLIFSIS